MLLSISRAAAAADADPTDRQEMANGQRGRERAGQRRRLRGETATGQLLRDFQFKEQVECARIRQATKLAYAFQEK